MYLKKNVMGENSTRCVEGENYKILKRFKKFGLDIDCLLLERAEYKWVTIEVEGSVINVPSKVMEKTTVYCPK